ncbi:hypothetical protein [Paracoccus mutanolyticus]|uniref:hypothetical protein n=1 Tax=Paracoccus mutanolyticus TaxID=1499308 RepID=UPI001CB8F638|nr:hypothetical protein [Paracoccus mutanolyticus]
MTTGAAPSFENISDSIPGGARNFLLDRPQITPPVMGAVAFRWSIPGIPLAHHPDRRHRPAFMLPSACWCRCDLGYFFLGIRGQGGGQGKSGGPGSNYLAACQFHSLFSSLDYRDVPRRLFLSAFWAITASMAGYLIQGSWRRACWKDQGSRDRLYEGFVAAPGNRWRCRRRRRWSAWRSARHPDSA